jgi:hypothetical protein
MKKKIEAWLESHPFWAAAVILFFGLLLLVLTAIMTSAPGRGQESELGGFSIFWRIPTELAVACLISGLLAVTFEGYSKRQTAASINGLGNNIFGARIYPIFSKLREEKFERSNVEFRMRILEPEEHEPESVKMDLVYKYKVRNRSSDDLPYELSVEIDELIEAAEELVTDIRLSWGGKIQKHETKSLEGLVKWTTMKKLRGHEEVEVDTRWRYKGRQYDDYPFFMSYITNGIEIEVEYPQRFTVNAAALTTKTGFELILQDDNQPTGSSFRTKRWRMDEDLLPGQTFLIKWKPAKQIVAPGHPSTEGI